MASLKNKWIYIVYVQFVDNHKNYNLKQMKIFITFFC